MLAFTGVTHFTAMREDYARMVPKILPNPKLQVAVSVSRRQGDAWERIAIPAG